MTRNQSTRRIEHFNRGELVFEVADAGQLDGEPVMLLHGWPQDQREWTTVAARLNDAGYRTIIPLQRGYSPGARPRPRRAYRVTELANDIVALIEGENLEPVHLVGHDWGAIVGWHLAANRPELLSTFTAVSVPHPLTFARSVFTSDQLRRSWYGALFQLPAIPEWFLARDDGFVFRRLVASGQTPDRVRRDLAKMADRATARGSLNWYRAIGDSPRGLFGKATIPTLMVGSDADIAVSPKAMRACGRYVSAPFSLEMISGVSHWIPDEVPDTLADLVLAHFSAHPGGPAAAGRID